RGRGRVHRAVPSGAAGRAGGGGMTRTVKIADVVVREGRRPLRDVDELADSIREVGLLNPITVTPDSVLIAGLHRLEACRRLGWTEIPCIVVEMQDVDRELA